MPTPQKPVRIGGPYALPGTANARRLADRAATCKIFSDGASVRQPVVAEVSHPDGSRRTVQRFPCPQFTPRLTAAKGLTGPVTQRAGHAKDETAGCLWPLGSASPALP